MKMKTASYLGIVMFLAVLVFVAVRQVTGQSDAKLRA
jgi:hypothetical protein